MDARVDQSSHEQAIAMALLAAYAAGVKAATPPPGHVIDDAGNVRKVLGDLLLLADGSVLGVGQDAVAYLSSGMKVRPYVFISEDPAPIEYDPSFQAEECWSTLEAAEAARKADSATTKP